MKKLLVVFCTILLAVSCKEQPKKSNNLSEQEKKAESNAMPELATIAPVTDKMMETAIIYEANIRQYSPEGTFDAFTKDIPQLKELGVKIIWLMPVFPISETKRKAKGDLMVEDIEDLEERKKYLGSYYAVSDYTKINPEFGDLKDFRELVNTAHQNGIYVILDWVPNHTGWDHKWISSNPDYFTQNEAGEIIYPKDTDWTDVADLNYENQDMRKAMIADMMYWIEEQGVDGFRCDVAGSVPLDFWEEAIPQLREKKELFMLAEAWEPELMHGNLFDMAYAWEGHHIMNEIAQGKKNLEDWNRYTMKMFTEYEEDDILMNFITNHDENSWNGTVKERMGDASELMLAFSYVIEGMPLIYSGQEYGLDHRLKFFEKDSIPKEKGDVWNTLVKLGHLKRSTPALHGGKNKASTLGFETSSKDVLKFARSKNGTKITFIGNFSNQKQTINIFNDTFIDYMNNKELSFPEEKLTFKPWEYKILLDKQ